MRYQHLFKSLSIISACALGEDLAPDKPKLNCQRPSIRSADFRGAQPTVKVQLGDGAQYFYDYEKPTSGLTFLNLEDSDMTLSMDAFGSVTISGKERDGGNQEKWRELSRILDVDMATIVDGKGNVSVVRTAIDGKPIQAIHDLMKYVENPKTTLEPAPYKKMLSEWKDKNGQINPQLKEILNLVFALRKTFCSEHEWFSQLYGKRWTDPSVSAQIFYKDISASDVMIAKTGGKIDFGKPINEPVFNMFYNYKNDV